MRLQPLLEPQKQPQGMVKPDVNPACGTHSNTGTAKHKIEIRNSGRWVLLEHYCSVLFPVTASV